MLIKILLLSAICLSLAKAGNVKGFARIPDYVPAQWAGMTDEQMHQMGENGGFFTNWISTDDSSVGTGDFEGVKKLLEHNNPPNDCPMRCAEPAGVEWKLVDNTYEARIDNCLVLKPEKFGQIKTMTYPGFACFNAYQMESTCSPQECEAIGMRNAQKRMIACDHCPDFQVRYLCTTPPMDVSPPYCPSASKRGLESELEILDSQIEARALDDSTIEEREIEVENGLHSPQTKEQKLQKLLREILGVK